MKISGLRILAIGLLAAGAMVAATGCVWYPGDVGVYAYGEGPRADYYAPYYPRYYAPYPYGGYYYGYPGFFFNFDFHHRGHFDGRHNWGHGRQWEGGHRR